MSGVKSVAFKISNSSRRQPPAVGGRGLFDFAAMYPDVFAALVPVCV